MFAKWRLSHCYCTSHYLCGVMTGVLLIHQSSMCWVMADTLFLHQSSLFSDGKRTTIASVFSVRSDDWRTITSANTVWGVMTEALLLHQLILVCGDGRSTITASVISVCGAMTGKILRNQSSLCAEWWLYSICASVIVGVTTDAVTACYQCVRSDDW